MRGVNCQYGGHLAADAVRGIRRAQQGQHGFLNAGGHSRRGPARRQQDIGTLTLGLDHRRHVIGQALAMHACRRRQHAVELDVLRQPGRIGTQERLDECCLPRWQVHSRQAICWPVLAQSARNAAKPLSVSGWLNNCRRMAGGTVQIWAPNLPASTTCVGLRTEATSTSVLNDA